MVKVNMQRLICNAGPFCGLVVELKRIIKHKRWNLAWIEMCLILFGWYIIENDFWKTKKKESFLYFIYFYSDVLDLAFQL